MSMVAYQAPFLLQVMCDDDPLNPREDYDNFGHMVCWHSRYNLGDSHDYEDTNALFQHLVRESVPVDTLLEYMKSGKAESVMLEYDRSQGGWEIKSYDSYFKKWYSEAFFEGSVENNKQEIFESLVETLLNKDLYALAAEKNLILPLNLYDHGGITMSVSSFLGRAQHAEWDSGQVGWILPHRRTFKRSMAICPKRAMKRRKIYLKAK